MAVSQCSCLASTPNRPVSPACKPVVLVLSSRFTVCDEGEPLEIITRAEASKSKSGGEPSDCEK